MSRKKLERADYYVAWIAPVSDLELLPSRLMLDEEHEAPDYDTAYDDNIYTCGSLAGHNVVIATCPPGMNGNVNAGRVTGSMFKTFSGVRMAVLVGIGGGVPQAQPSDDPTENVHLGDVIVGWPGDGGPACVYYDSGKQHVDGEFEVYSMINRPDHVLLNALAKLVSDHEMGQSTFQKQQERLLRSKQKRKFTFPGVDRDRLFQATYSHQGPNKNQCATCDKSQLVQRPARTEEDLAGFIFHRGRIATGNAVIKDGQRRDQIRDLCRGALCIEMEAAGVDANRPCLVIRGISDYADSHKDDVWRSYAAGNAAVLARELLIKIPPGRVRSLDIDARPKSHFLLRFSQNEDFVGRKDSLSQLLERLPPAAYPNACQRTVIEGLGGIGKTQVAIEAAYRVRKAYPDCSIFWVPAVNMAMFENAYREIGRSLGVNGIEEEKADVKKLVKAALSQANAGQWLLIIDNADDILLLTDGQLMSSLPFSLTGSILFTTRNHQVAVRLNGRVISLQEPGKPEASELLHQGLEKRQIGNPKHTTELLDYLAYLPLAVRQASAYMESNRTVTISKYVGFCSSSDKERIKLLSEEFTDQARYETARNPVALTWLISFEHIARDKPLAAEYLQFVCYLAEKDIPTSLFPPGDSERMASEAISTLEAYAFLQRKELGIQRDNMPDDMEGDAPDRFDVHRLVRLVMRNWLREQVKDEEQITKTIFTLAKKLPLPTHENRKKWSGYLPHTQAVLEFGDQCANEGALWRVLFCTGIKTNLIGKYDEAENFCSKAVNLAKKSHGPTHFFTLTSMNSLANTLEGQGKYREAETMYREILPLMEMALGQTDPETLGCMSNLAIVLKNQDKYEEAERIHRRTLALRKTALGPGDPGTLASMNNLALVLKQQGKYEEAETMHREELRLCGKIRGPEHPSTLNSMNNLANVLSKQGKHEEAEAIHRQTLKLKETALGPEHPSTLDSMNNLANVLDKQKKYEEAEMIHRQTLTLRERLQGREHPDTLRNMMLLASVLTEQEKHTEAEQICRRLNVLGRQR